LPGSRSLVPADGPNGRSLLAVVAILAFLAALAAAGAEIVVASSAEWRTAINREATIQVRPAPGRDIEADVAAAAALAREATGVAGVRVLSRSDAEDLLRPWLGGNVDLGDLPVPRLVVLRLDRASPPDLGALATAVASRVSSATLDDHRAALARLSTAANAVVAVSAALVALVLLAAALAVTFATRGAMTGNRAVVEILHLVGADDRFIAREFRSRFARIGLAGGFLGGATACLSLWILGQVALPGAGSGSPAELEALFGSFVVGLRGYAVVALIALAVGALAGLVSGLAVRRYLAER
jgi:cell division transport system permease protein